MPNYNKTTLCSVPLGGLTYLYRTNVPESARADFGITAVTNDIPAGAIFEANSPKPARATVKVANGETNSSYIDSSKLALLRATGASIEQPRYRKINELSSSAKVVTVTATIDQVPYTWNMPKELHTRIAADLAGLGIELANGLQIRELVWSTTSPRPARVTKTVQGEDGLDTYETFCAESKETNLPEGWSISEPHITSSEYFFGRI